MRQPAKETAPEGRSPLRLLAYVADLELEVDRLRRQGQFIQQEVRDTLKRILQLCADAPAAGDAPSRPVVCLG